MQGKTQKAILLDQYGLKPYFKENVPIPQLKQNQFLIKVEASTINPSDRLFLQGHYMRRTLPTICGLEGTGIVVEAKGEAVQSWIGKRVSFTSMSGSWCEYAVSNPFMTFQIEKDVPISSAASGVVNPLTVIGFIQHYKALQCKGGIIHTAAASALGRQLNKLCQKQKIPLLNIVRRQQQLQLLKKQGAEHILVTQGNWQQEYKKLMHKGFQCVFDCLGGGPVTDKIISNLLPGSFYHVYGTLQPETFIISSPFVLFTGVGVTGFNVMGWWGSQSQEVKNRVRSQYSNLLKCQLSTHTFKQLKLRNIDEAIQLSVKNATEGKILLRI